jgi:phosphate transport system substrate-binding protein
MKIVKGNRTLIKTINTRGLYLLLLPLMIEQVHGAQALRIVGSSAVFPFASTVAEYFHYKTHHPMPLVESIGTGAGIKLFCGDIKGPDGVMASRPITPTEREKCKTNGVLFMEFTVGQDGLVLIQNKQSQPFALSLQELDNALSAKIKLGDKCLPNPYKAWDQIQEGLPSSLLRIFGPASSTGTYDILIEKLKNVCGPFLRHDKAYIEAPANENLIVQKVLSRPDTLGIVTFSFYEPNEKRLQAVPLNGVVPSRASIQEKKYPLSRPLYMYIKTNDLLHHPDRKAYMVEFTSQEASGGKGYLTKKGLIPLSVEEQKTMQERALRL